MSPEQFFAQELLQNLLGEEGVKAVEDSSHGDVLVEEIFVEMLLEVIDEKHSVHPSLPGLDEFDDGSVGWDGVVEGVA